MFSNLTVALLAGIGGGTWVYVKIFRSSGNNNKTAIIVGGSAGFGIFVVLLMIMNSLFKS